MAAVIRIENESTPCIARYNPYIVVHKGLRAFMTDVLLQWGRADVRDDCERNQAVEYARGLLTTLRSHLRHENDFVHTAIERVRPGFTARIAHEHIEHEAAIAGLESSLDVFVAADVQQRPMLAQGFYQALSVFIGENFEHMVVEETENFRVLSEEYSEADVLGIEHAIVASLSPEESFAGLRWMIGHSNASERAFLLGGMKQGAPAEVFSAVMDLARQVLSQRDFYKLERALA